MVANETKLIDCSIANDIDETITTSPGEGKGFMYTLQDIHWKELAHMWFFHTETFAYKINLENLLSPS